METEKKISKRAKIFELIAAGKTDEEIRQEFKDNDQKKIQYQIYRCRFDAKKAKQVQ